MRIEHHDYGKSAVRLTKITRHADRHDLKELSVDITLGGDFEASYTAGDNRQVVATDSMKNTVYVMAKRHPLDSIESFAAALAEHFVSRYPQVSHAIVSISEDRWRRIRSGQREYAHAFTSDGNEVRTCEAVLGPEGMRVSAGLDDLLVLKTTDSAFRNFVRDEFTTLPDTDDRVFATSVSAEWEYGRVPASWNHGYETVREALLSTFAEHKSLAVQQTLYAMGEAALAACPEVERISLTMPNKHRILVNLRPFGLENHNEVFVPTDEPFGRIAATLTRG